MQSEAAVCPFPPLSTFSEYLSCPPVIIQGKKTRLILPYNCLPFPPLFPHCPLFLIFTQYAFCGCNEPLQCPLKLGVQSANVHVIVCLGGNISSTVADLWWRYSVHVLSFSKISTSTGPYSILNLFCSTHLRLGKDHVISLILINCCVFHHKMFNISKSVNFHLPYLKCFYCSTLTVAGTRDAKPSPPPPPKAPLSLPPSTAASDLELRASLAKTLTLNIIQVVNMFVVMKHNCKNT